MRDDYRNEKKFIFFYNQDSILTYLNYLNLKKLYEKRKINSIYFDSIYYSDYFDAVEGLLNRKKTRIRWYGETFNNIIKPVLEIKTKSNNYNYKIRKNLFTYKVNNYFNIRHFNSLINEHKKQNIDINYFLNIINPTIFITYDRKYLYYNNIRITLDYNIKFKNLNNVNLFKNSNLNNSNKIIVVELKYENKYKEEAEFLGVQFNKRIEKISKYQEAIFYTKFL